MKCTPWMVGLAATSMMSCGSVDSNERLDAATADSTVDTPADGPSAPCDRARPFQAPTLLTSLNTAEDDSGASLADGETLIFVAGRPTATANSQIYYATRASVSEPFGARQPVVEVNIGDSFNPTLTTDGLTMFLSSNGAGTVGGHDFFVSTRPNATASWGTPVNVPNINSTSDNEYAISVTGDGNDLYFQSGRLGVAHLWHSSRAGGTFGSPVQLMELSDPAGEGGVAVRADGLELYFASTRTGTHGGEDIWVASRTSRTQPFGTPQNVTELNTAQNEYPSWVSSDGCRIVLSSNRPGGQGAFDLWEARRPE